MDDLASNGDGQKLEEEIRRKQEKCPDQKGKEKNTCLKEKMGDYASSGKRAKRSTVHNRRRGGGVPV